MPHITAGALRGRRLSVPGHIRATEAKVRQAIFNILGSFVEGARVIDGFAGSGALGFEALSRGAGFVAFIESDSEAVLAIRQNVERLGFELPREDWRILHLDVVKGLSELAKTERPFELAIFDPPYGTDGGKKALNALVECAILAPAGVVVVEHDLHSVLPESFGPLKRGKRHRYGDTVLSLYRSG